MDKPNLNDLGSSTFVFSETLQLLVPEEQNISMDIEETAIINQTDESD